MRGIYFSSVQSLIVFPIIICLLFTLKWGSRRTRHDNLGSKKKKNYCKLLDKNTHNIVDFSDNHSEIIILPMTASVRNMTNYTQVKQQKKIRLDI